MLSYCPRCRIEFDEEKCPYCEYPREDAQDYARENEFDIATIYNRYRDEEFYISPKRMRRYRKHKDRDVHSIPPLQSKHTEQKSSDDDIQEHTSGGTCGSD